MVPCLALCCTFQTIRVNYFNRFFALAGFANTGPGRRPADAGSTTGSLPGKTSWVTTGKPIFHPPGRPFRHRRRARFQARVSLEWFASVFRSPWTAVIVRKDSNRRANAVGARMPLGMFVGFCWKKDVQGDMILSDGRYPSKIDRLESSSLSSRFLFCTPRRRKASRIQPGQKRNIPKTKCPTWHFYA